MSNGCQTDAAIMLEASTLRGAPRDCMWKHAQIVGSSVCVAGRPATFISWGGSCFAIFCQYRDNARKLPAGERRAWSCTQDRVHCVARRRSASDGDWDGRSRGVWWRTVSYIRKCSAFEGPINLIFLSVLVRRQLPTLVLMLPVNRYRKSHLRKRVSRGAPRQTRR